MKKYAVIALGMTTAALVAAGLLAPGTPLSARSEVTLRHPATEVWTALSNLSQAHLYVPGITRTEITSDAARGIGTSRRVYDADGTYLNETVSEWTEGDGFVLRLHNDGGKAPAPFTAARSTLSILRMPQKKQLLKTKHLKIRHQKTKCLIFPETPTRSLKAKLKTISSIFKTPARIYLCRRFFFKSNSFKTGYFCETRLALQRVHQPELG